MRCSCSLAAETEPRGVSAPLRDPTLFSHIHTQSSGGHVADTIATGANFMAPPSLPRVRANGKEVISPPLVSEILSAPASF